jgi:hypothetical protein
MMLHSFDFGEHPGNWDGKYMYLYFRSNNSYKSVSAFNHDAACGERDRPNKHV